MSPVLRHQDTCLHVFDVGRWYIISVNKFQELYEPLWDDLVQSLEKRGRRIRSIWFSDVSNQGASGLLNDKLKYEDVNDHSRDLFHMVNQFRSEMIQPLMAVGHSIGANQLAFLSVAHPTLFSALVLIDPIFAPLSNVHMGFGLAKATLARKVEWSSRQAAENTFKRAFRSWDSRVLQKFNEFALYPYHDPAGEDSEKPQATRLITNRFQELLGYVRPSFIHSGDSEVKSIPWVQEALMANAFIGFIPVNTLYVCGAESVASSPEFRKDWLKRTGTANHLGKRVRKRRVEAVVVPNKGHFVPMEAPRACAEAIADWINEETMAWKEEEAGLEERWGQLSLEQKEKTINAWMAELKAKI
ncbi:hypothetical protein B7494_g8128 [Chlorociboria aeruginascens]|nr:hypothetical protein B7494_g8128 [Chlorociboria aeruginascens]